jgi:hypothetical protein
LELGRGGFAAISIVRMGPAQAMLVDLEDGERVYSEDTFEDYK